MASLRSKGERKPSQLGFLLRGVLTAFKEFVIDPDGKAPIPPNEDPPSWMTKAREAIYRLLGGEH